MESLALLVTIIVAPALFGGPLAFILTLWRPSEISPLRRRLIYILGIASVFIGGYLVIANISRGGSIIGFTVIITGVAAIARARRAIA